MRTIEKLLLQYNESHQNKTNVLIHAIAVPSIYFVTLGLIWAIPVPDFIADFNVTWAHVLAIPILFYYFKLSGPIGAAMTLLTIVCFGGINLIAYYGLNVWLFCLSLFVVMWILQFIGHKIEGKKPSFLEDLRFLLVGPAWWWMHWLKRLNISY
ncbi:Mpo1-like protein [Alteromonas sp. CI.11.F.A3]|uniref:Mpo1 family 2-hydroxy fatty acid dioxygenase n=1 Tax=Alteromonas sp. CI.11.F.A3 TaxID=3079555 RepID=UPI002943D0FD|nr:Mpo1-like protein [Alteromonas sp. CI.11.F.A3]WOI35658.1 Mpo1-like protein [Alteromonas sp. CI.11.F.A3]